ncbi:MAG: hypothetical protein KUL79_15135 [Thauera sp.]|nr:hypothetical protein [Thauera sp.]
MNADALRELERVEWRVLAALRPIDAVTGATIVAPLRVTAAGARIARNRSGLYVIHEWPALATHAAAFDAPPALPAPGSLALTVSVADAAGQYLPRLARIALPRAPAAAGENSLFSALAVALHPAPTARLGINWCALRVSLAHRASGDALGGALLRVVAGDAVLARGLSDWRGEALVPVAGIPVTTWSEDEDAVVVSHVAATLEAIFDPDAGTRTPLAEVRSGRPPPRLPQVDPDDIESRRVLLPRAQQDISLAARGALNLNLGLDLP